MFLPLILLVLLCAHLVVAYQAGVPDVALAQGLAIAIQGVALVAVLKRWRRCPGNIAQLWLMLGLAVLAQMLWGGANLLAGVLGLQ